MLINITVTLHSLLIKIRRHDELLPTHHIRCGVNIMPPDSVHLRLRLDSWFIHVLPMAIGDGYRS